MKIPLPTFLLVLAAVITPARVAPAQAPPIRIMPLGDSLTNGTYYGTAGVGGYRGPLYTLLTNAGYNVDYMGTMSDNSELLVEKEHEGHPGKRIEQLDPYILGWLDAVEAPDVILLHIGTNDIRVGYTPASVLSQLSAFVGKIAAKRPNAHIIVTTLMERDEPWATIIREQFNPGVAGIVSAHAAAGRHVSFLDMHAAVPLSDMPDQLHPYQAGYNKMAAAWFTAIQSAVPLAGAEPLAEFLSRHGIADPAEDADHDGLNAVLEWFLGGDPESADLSPLPVGACSAASAFTFSFTMPESRGAATWEVQSSHGDGWTAAVPGADGVAITSGSAAAGRIPVSVTFEGATAPFFARLVVTPP